ncbi:MAG: CHASE domain-containing protein [Methylococcales bacterium]|nr:CHASE domain-containing protein [Methylococcales bacterium]
MNNLPPAPHKRWFVISGVALLYFLAGKLSYLAVIPPGYDAIIWPASGVALASILYFGYRVWPGIFIGAFFVNALIGNLSSQISENLIGLLISLVISIGATFQAILGAYLVKRFAGFPDNFIKGNQLFLFFLLGGAVSALVNSTLSVTTLTLAGRTPVIDFFSKWVVWWSGDFLGVFIFCPLILVWLWPKQQWGTRRLVLTFTIAVLFILTGLAVFSAKSHGDEELEGDFNLRASVMNAELESAIVAHLNALYSLERFYASSDNVTSKQFETFVNHYFDEMKSIQALSLDSVVYGLDRQDFENKMRLQGHPQFSITERDVNNQFVPAKQRNVYAPVTYIQPEKNNVGVLGFDMYSEPMRRKVFEQAMVSGDIAMTGPLRLVLGDGGLRGVIAEMPLYKKNLPHLTVPDRKQNITACVTLVLLLDKIVFVAFQDIDYKDLAFRAIDKNSTTGEHLLFEKDWNLAYSMQKQERSYFGEPFSLTSKTTIQVANRLWNFEIVPTRTWLDEHNHPYQEVVLMVGLVLTGLAGVFIWVVSGREVLLAAQMQDKARQSQFIAHLDRQRSLGAMAASLGHELNQPLTAIMTNAQVAQRGLLKETLSPALLEELLDKIVFNTRRTHLIIEKIRSFIQPSKFERLPIDIIALVKDTLEFLTQEMMASQIKVNFFLVDEKLFVLGDAIQLSQVLLNIYRNALEVLQHSTSRRYINISVTQLDDWTVITITDSGPGFSKEALKQVATPFYTTKSSGLGLGLSISRDIIEQHLGQLLINNNEYGGACFEIRIPSIKY